MPFILKLTFYNDGTTHLLVSIVAITRPGQYIRYRHVVISMVTCVNSNVVIQKFYYNLPYYRSVSVFDTSGIIKYLAIIMCNYVSPQIWMHPKKASIWMNWVTLFDKALLCIIKWGLSLVWNAVLEHIAFHSNLFFSKCTGVCSSLSAHDFTVLNSLLPNQ